MRLPIGSSISPRELKKVMRKFRKKYPTEAKCTNGLITLTKLDIANCRECGSKNVQHISGTSNVVCNACKSTVDVFDNTIFQRIQLPAAYLAAIWLRQRQIEVSENLFADHMGISQSTAHVIEKKIDTVILETLMDESIEVDSSLFAEIVCKRSSETPAREEPRKEQDAVDAKLRQKYEETRNRKADSESDETEEFDETICPAEMQLKVYRTFSDKPLVADEIIDLTGLPTSHVLGILSCLEAQGKVRRTRIGAYQRVNKRLGLDKFFNIDSAKLQQFFDHVRRIFHGVSRKHLQKFLARYWGFVGAQFKDSDLLFQACGKHPPISREQLRSFVTEPMVKVLFA